jgi:hypothetical protein
MNAQRITRGVWTMPRDDEEGRPPPTAPPGDRSQTRRVYGIERLDAAAVKAVDPLWPPTCVLFGDLDDELELRQGDDIIARLRPADSEPGSLDLAIEAFDLVVAQHGHDDDGSTDPRWTAEGAEAMVEVLRRLPRGGGLREWRGERDVVLRLRRGADAPTGWPPTRSPP